MGKAKVVSQLGALLGIYFVAAGGFHAVFQTDRGFFEVLLDPLRRSSWDVAFLMGCAVLLAWAQLVSGRGGFGRSPLLSGIALGSALISGACLVVVLNAASDGTPLQTAIFGSVALFQAVVGLTAAALMVCREESRKGSMIPLILNGGLTAAAAFVTCIPIFA